VASDFVKALTKCIQRIRDLFEYALYKFTLYLLTYEFLICTCEYMIHQICAGRKLQHFSQLWRYVNFWWYQKKSL